MANNKYETVSGRMNWVIGGIGLVACGALMVFSIGDGFMPHPSDKMVRTEPQAVNGPCVSYKLAVAKCGVHNEWEFETSQVDSAVKANYNGLRYVTQGELIAPSYWYLQYKRDGVIYWTRHKIRLPAAEPVALVTNGPGEFYLRARCGNRMSDKPQQPVEAIQPNAIELGTQVADTEQQTEPTTTSRPPAGSSDISPIIPLHFNRVLQPISANTVTDTPATTDRPSLGTQQLGILAAGLVPVQTQPDHVHVTPEPKTGGLVFLAGVVLAIYGVKLSRKATK